MTFNYYIPTRILFGCGSLGRLSEETLPGKTALIVTTNGHSVKKYGYLDRVEKELAKAGVSYDVYDKVEPNPVTENVEEGADLARKIGADFLVGLGGGSAIDAAKAMAVVLANGGHIWDYTQSGTGKKEMPKKPALPVVAITTTAGTGTEADPWYVITHTATNEKIGGGFPSTFPVLAIVDPELMVSVPSKFTAYQGFDALFHSAEGYINKTSYVMSDMYALKAISLLGKSLPEAVKNGKNLAAREDVALANTLAGMVESTSGCTSEHSIAHPMTGFHPSFVHGAALISISAAYFTYWAKSGVCGRRLMDMAEALTGKKAAEPMDFVKALVSLQKACGVDDIKMSDFGMKREEIPVIAEAARKTMGGLYEVDPAPITDDDVIHILEESYR